MALEPFKPENTRPHRKCYDVKLPMWIVCNVENYYFLENVHRICCTKCIFSVFIVRVVRIRVVYCKNALQLLGHWPKMPTTIKGLMVLLLKFDRCRFSDSTPWPQTNSWKYTESQRKFAPIFSLTLSLLLYSRLLFSMRRSLNFTLTEYFVVLGVIQSSQKQIYSLCLLFWLCL